MKKLVTAADIKNCGPNKTIYVEAGTIVTPAARDLAAERGVAIKIGAAGLATEAASKGCAAGKADGISADMIAKIVRQVLASLPGLPRATGMIKEDHPSGVRLVRGKTVHCEPFNTGNPGDKVGLTEILNIKESPSMATGFMTLEGPAFEWHLMYDEIDYVVEGTLEIVVDGQTFSGQPGDVLFIPRDTTVTFRTPDKTRFFFVTYPANRAEFSGHQK
jgi:ethanolamine utilization protein EutQ